MSFDNRATISDFQAKMAAARGEMEKTQSAGSSKFQALGKGAGLVLAAVGVAGIGIAGASVKMASDFEDAQTKLQTAIGNTGAKFSQFAPQVSAADQKMQGFGFTNTETADALAAGVTATGSASAALSLLTTAANLAAFKHIDLATAMTAVARASEGQTRPLAQLGIIVPALAVSGSTLKSAQDALAKAQGKVNDVLTQFPDAASAASKGHKQYEAAIGAVTTAQGKLNELSQSGAQIMEVLNQKLGGQAAAASETFAGKLKAAKASVEDLGIKLGLVLIPVIEKVVTAISSVVTWFEKHRVAAAALGGVIVGVLVAGLIVLLPAMYAAAVAAVAMVLPFLPLIAACAALGAAAYLLATHWSQIWSDIKGWFDDAVKFLRSGFGTLVILITGPFAPLLLLALHWQEVWTGVKQVMGDALSVVINGFKMLVDATFAMVEGVLSAASHLPFIGSHFADALKSVKSFQSDVDSTLSGLATSMSQWGDAAGSGLAGGLSKGLIASLPSVLNTTASVAASVAGAMRKGLGVASPSTITTEIGMFVAKGLEVGMLGGVSGVSGAASRLAGAAGGIAPSGGSFAAGDTAGIAALGAGGGSGPVTVVLQVGTREMARALWPDLRSFVLQNAKRDAVKVGLS